MTSSNRFTHSAYWQKKTVKEVFGTVQGKVTYREDINTPIKMERI